MVYKVYVSDGNTEMSLTYYDLHKAVIKLEELAQQFPEYMVSIKRSDLINVKVCSD